jgi:hypothetical protein
MELEKARCTGYRHPADTSGVRQGRGRAMSTRPELGDRHHRALQSESSLRILRPVATAQVASTQKM